MGHETDDIDFIWPATFDAVAAEYDRRFGLDEAHLRAIGELAGAEVEVGYGDWRPGDQRWYVSDTRSLSRAIDLPRPLGWRSGLERLARWLRTDGRDAEVLASPVAEVV